VIKRDVGELAMPKVSKEYVDEKKREIVDAAIRVCKAKPAYAVTLRDIVKEGGISQGRMYHYFSNIDEIFANIVNSAQDEISIADEMAAIFDSDAPPEKIIVEAFAAVGRMVGSLHRRFGGLMGELAHLYMADAERRNRFEKMTMVNDDLAVFYERLGGFIDAGAESGRFNPTIPKKQILFTVANAIEGLDDGLGFITDNAKRFNVEIEQGTEAEKSMMILANIVTDLLHIREEYQ
jgi:AcrR family transcriptional regulator